MYLKLILLSSWIKQADNSNNTGAMKDIEFGHAMET